MILFLLNSLDSFIWSVGDLLAIKLIFKIDLLIVISDDKNVLFSELRTGRRQPGGTAPGGGQYHPKHPTTQSVERQFKAQANLRTENQQTPRKPENWLEHIKRHATTMQSEGETLQHSTVPS